MMYRVYYVVRTIDQVQIALDRLQEANIGTNRVHVMANNNAELTSRGIQATTPWEDTNIMNTGFFWAFVGAIIGLLVGWALTGIDPWGIDIGFGGVVLSVLFFGAHGAWAGGIRGISHTNYHLKPYLQDLKRGCYLIMVDVDFKEEHDRVHHVLDHALKADRQDDDTRYNPML